MDLTIFKVTFFATRGQYICEFDGTVPGHFPLRVPVLVGTAIGQAMQKQGGSPG